MKENVNERSLWQELKLKAEDMAWNAHFGQMSKDEVPYIQHLWRVEEKVFRYIPQEINTNKTEIYKYQIVAVLHDTLEDTRITDYDIMELFGIDILNAVRSVTRGKDEKYSDFIKRCAENPIGKAVKLADLEDNLNLSRIAKNENYDYSDRDSHRLEKYFKAYQYLRFGKGEPIN